MMALAPHVSFIILVTASLLKNVNSNQDSSKNVTDILDSFLKDYDRRLRPQFGGPPVEVSTTMYVLSITDLSESNMDFTLDIYFRQFWKDDRLKFTPINGITRLMPGASFINNIWVPDTFFVNEKKSYFHNSTVPNEYLRINHNGDVLRSTRLTITAACPMNLQYFPMDRQLCTVELESFAFTMTDIKYQWQAKQSAIGMSKEVSLPQFQVLGYRQKTKEAILTTGNYSRLAAEILLVRSLGYYLIQMYIPAALMVIISWVSFWLHRDAVTARVLVCVATLLSITTLMTSISASLPKISYIRAIDEYLGTCFLMVFAVLLEYASVGYVAKKIRSREATVTETQKIKDQSKAGLTEEEGNTADVAKSDVEEGRHNHLGKCLNRLYSITPSDLDKYSRVMFPVVFFCFNLGYWLKYIPASDLVPHNLVFLHS